LRYRGGTLAELWRALRLLKALQAEQAARPEPAMVAAPPIEPERRRNSDRIIASCAAEPSAAPEPVAATPTSVEAGRPAGFCALPAAGRAGGRTTNQTRQPRQTLLACSTIRRDSIRLDAPTMCDR
jgi:hypothetical protein